jgi:hypothetical protein
MPRRETLEEIKKRARKDRLKIRKKVLRKYGSGPFSKATKRLITFLSIVNSRILKFSSFSFEVTRSLKFSCGYFYNSEDFSFLSIVTSPIFK